MKKLLFATIAFGLPAVMAAQSATDIYSLSQTDIRGTARFMSMGGAFTALGGDLSTLTQNPAGIGVYRRSEIGATLDISPQSVSATTNTNKNKISSTTVACNNFGYIGTVRLNGAMQTFSWGASYNRLTSFDRKVSAYSGSTSTSLSNYIASFSYGTPYSAMEFNSNTNYNPYFDSDADWLSILAYSAYMINPTGGSSYTGLFQNGTQGDAMTEMRESGYVDEYAIDFGGNVGDVVMWGIGFGITDLKYNRQAYYSESMSNAYVATADGRMVTGDAGFDLNNYRHINGNGFNFKLGLIFKPINDLRIGVAFHTPTWYSMSSAGYGEVDYSYYNPAAQQGRDNPFTGYDYTEDSYYNFHMTAPWRFMIGVAGVLGSSAIVSVDYECQAYNKMRTSYQGSFNDYVSNDWVNSDIDQYYKAANILRVGAEFRVTPSFSVRAGYNYTSTTASSYALDGGEVLTAGTDPSYTLDRGVNAISVGLGYRYKAFYIDGAYVYRNKKSTYKAYTNFDGYTSPSADLTQVTNSIVLSAGFKF